MFQPCPAFPGWNLIDFHFYFVTSLFYFENIPQFEPFPQLEPFPFKPDPPRQEKKNPPAGQTIRKPAKFVQGQFTESDYESDLEGARIPPRWLPPGSDTDDTSGYKKVKLPKLSSSAERSGQTFPKDKTPSPPSKFDANPPQFDGPPRPEFKRISPPPVVQPEPVPVRKPSITGTETVQRVQMEESTRFSKRFVTGN